VRPKMLPLGSFRSISAVSGRRPSGPSPSMRDVSIVAAEPSTCSSGGGVGRVTIQTLVKWQPWCRGVRESAYVITGLHFDAAWSQTTATGFSSVPTPDIVMRTESRALSVNASGGTTPAPVSNTAPFGNFWERNR
jgi:hypothetical protein